MTWASRRTTGLPRMRAIVGDRSRQVSEMSERQHLAWPMLPERKQ